jgi:hypothetical protein
MKIFPSDASKVASIFSCGSRLEEHKTIKGKINENLSINFFIS